MKNKKKYKLHEPCRLCQEEKFFKQKTKNNFEMFTRQKTKKNQLATMPARQKSIHPAS